MNLKFFLIIAVTCLFVIGCVEERQDIGPEVKNMQTKPIDYGQAIAEITTRHEAYNGQEVVVSGKVMPGLAFEFINEQPYQIIQGESLLWVITDDISPVEGTFVTVRGKIAAPYQIKGRAYRLVLLEEERL